MEETIVTVSQTGAPHRPRSSGSAEANDTASPTPAELRASLRLPQTSVLASVTASGTPNCNHCLHTETASH